MLTRRGLLKTGLGAVAAVTAAAPEANAGPATRYRIDGEGEPLLLIAGFSCDLSVFDTLTPHLSANGFRVIRINNPGVGEDLPSTPVTIPTMAAAALRLIDDLKLPQLHVIGHSMGGQIAQELALAEPGQVRSLTLLSSWAKASPRLVAITREFGELAGKIAPEDWQRAFLPWLLTDAVYTAPGVIEQAVTAYVTNPARLSPALLAAQADAIATSDTTRRLAAIAVPTLIAVGEEDILTPPALSRGLYAAIAGATFALLPAGHGNIVEAAPNVAARIAEFIRSIR